MRSAAVVIVVGLLVGGADRSVWARPVGKCTQQDPEYARALELLSGADDRMRQLAPGASVTAAQNALRAVLDHRCFALAREAGAVADTDDALSLKTWWLDGGLQWLDSYLRGDDPRVVFPPELRPVLTSESEPASPLAPLLCPRGDLRCGAETRGWVLRANAAFRGESGAFPANEPGSSERSEATEPCDDEAQPSASNEQRYAQWHLCEGSAAPRVPVIPLGQFRAPDHGWFVLRGRRGHYQFCDEIRAYDLGSGAAYISSSCSSLALTGGGSVDRARTDQQRAAYVYIGTVPLESLREAAWMTLFAPVVVASQVHSYSAPLPEGLIPRMDFDDLGGGFLGSGIGSFWVSSAQTRLSWRWVEGADLLAEGTLTWPNSSDAGEHYAANLWRIAEAAFVEGCPPARLPSLAAGGTEPGVSGVDASPEQVRQQQSELGRSLELAREQRTCEQRRPHQLQQAVDRLHRLR